MNNIDKSIQDWLICFVDASPLRTDENTSIWNSSDNENIKVLRLPVLRDKFNLKFVDIVQLSDVVVTKPGYGTVAEIILHRKRCLWVRRPHFAEEPFLVEKLKQYTIVEEIDSKSVLNLDLKLFKVAEKLMSFEMPILKEKNQNEIVVNQIFDWMSNKQTHTCN